MRPFLVYFFVFLLPTHMGMALDGWTNTVKAAKQKIVRIEIAGEGQDSPFICSGVVINAERGFVLTCAHCVEGNKDNLAVTVNGRHAEIARTNRLLDQAVIRYNPKGEATMEIAPESPEIGTQVAVLGHPFGVEEVAAQFGTVSQSYNKETKTIWIDATIIPGDSGGAVIDQSGRLVGLTSRYYYSGATHIGAAMPVEQILDFVEPYLPVKARR